jgi:hypothetical protein
VRPNALHHGGRRVDRDEPVDVKAGSEKHAVTPVHEVPGPCIGRRHAALNDQSSLPGREDDRLDVRVIECFVVCAVNREEQRAPARQEMRFAVCAFEP